MGIEFIAVSISHYLPIKSTLLRFYYNYQYVVKGLLNAQGSYCRRAITILFWSSRLWTVSDPFGLFTWRQIHFQSDIHVRSVECGKYFSVRNDLSRLINCRVVIRSCAPSTGSLDHTWTHGVTGQKRTYDSERSGWFVVWQDIHSFVPASNQQYLFA